LNRTELRGLTRDAMQKVAADVIAGRVPSVSSTAALRSQQIAGRSGTKAGMGAADANFPQSAVTDRTNSRQVDHKSMAPGQKQFDVSLSKPKKATWDGSQTGAI
jgi:hypothetical protein